MGGQSRLTVRWVPTAQQGWDFRTCKAVPRCFPPTAAGLSGLAVKTWQEFGCLALQGRLLAGWPAAR